MRAMGGACREDHLPGPLEMRIAAALTLLILAMLAASAVVPAAIGGDAPSAVATPAS